MKTLIKNIKHQVRIIDTKIGKMFLLFPSYKNFVFIIQILYTVIHNT